MVAFVEAAIVISVSLLLSICSWKLKMLTVSGAIAAFFTGSIVGLTSNLEWFFLLILFTVSGLVATRIGFERKLKKGIQEGKHGERTHLNVLGVGIPPCIISIIYLLSNGQYSFELTIAFISTMAVSAADTIASEIGTKDERVWLITTFKRVKPGVNGGISLFGTGISIVAAFIISTIGWLMIYHTIEIYILIPTLAGLVGNMLDSLLGATLEDGGYISKYTNNCVTSLMGAAFGAAVAFLVI
jgi:uncharacterized protein (TIGR00297 family)